MEGGSLTASTVTTKATVEVLVPSLTSTETVVLPVWLGRGLHAMARSTPTPVRRRLASGSRAGLLDRALTTRLDAGVSTSPTVKGTSGLEVSSFRTWFGIA